MQHVVVTSGFVSIRLVFPLRLRGKPRAGDLRAAVSGGTLSMVATESTGHRWHSLAGEKQSVTVVSQAVILQYHFFCRSEMHPSLLLRGCIVTKSLKNLKKCQNNRPFPRPRQCRWVRTLA